MFQQTQQEVLVGQFHLVALLRQLFLQRPIHQRYRNIDVPDLKLGGIEGGISVFIANMPGDRDPDIFARDGRKKFSVDHIAVKADLLVFNCRAWSRDRCLAKVVRPLNLESRRPPGRSPRLVHPAKSACFVKTEFVEIGFAEIGFATPAETGLFEKFFALSRIRTIAACQLVLTVNCRKQAQSRRLVAMIAVTGSTEAGYSKMPMFA